MASRNAAPSPTYNIDPAGPAAIPVAELRAPEPIVFTASSAVPIFRKEKR